jgi:hypothetical protein
MARAAKPKPSARRAPGAKPPKAPPKASPKANAPGTEVERRWQDYWDRRSRLEQAVDAVRTATAALKKAQEDERARRTEFDEVKKTLTTLLDVEPVGAATAPPAAASGRDPIPLQRSVTEPPKQVG